MKDNIIGKYYMRRCSSRMSDAFSVQGYDLYHKVINEWEFAHVEGIDDNGHIYGESRTIQEEGGLDFKFFSYICLACSIDEFKYGGWYRVTKKDYDKAIKLHKKFEKYLNSVFSVVNKNTHVMPFINYNDILAFKHVDATTFTK